MCNMDSGEKELSILTQRNKFPSNRLSNCSNICPELANHKSANLSCCMVYYSELHCLFLLPLKFHLLYHYNVRIPRDRNSIKVHSWLVQNKSVIWVQLFRSACQSRYSHLTWDTLAHSRLAAQLGATFFHISQCILRAICDIIACTLLCQPLTISFPFSVAYLHSIYKGESVFFIYRVIH